jgi:glycine oxidase
MPRPCDIIVIGAGIVGCAIAHELTRRGASLQIVDGRAAGMGATQASAGILAPYIEAEGELLDLTVRSLDLFDEFVARIAGDSGIPIPYRRTGTLQVTTDAERWSALRTQASRLDAGHVPYEVLEPRAVSAEEPHITGDVAGAMVVPSHGFVVVGELMRSLLAAARAQGAQLIEGGRVRRISRSASRGGGEMTVDTDRGPLTANAVVLAAGSWSTQIDIEGVSARIPVRPVRGQLLRLGWVGPPLRRVTWGDRCYLVPWDDGTVLVGATVEEAGFDERATVAGVRELLDAACELVPNAVTAGFLGARVGFRPASPDDLPVIGPSRLMPGLMYASGHFRSGILLAPLTARLVADAILDDAVDPAMRTMSPDRFGDL